MPRTIFADANSDYENAQYIIFGVPFDGTSCFRKGSRFAPQVMRTNSYNFETYNHLYGIDLNDVNIHDAGDLDVAPDINGTLEMISSHADKFVDDGKISIMLGGEHSLTFPFVRACKRKYDDIGFVVLDAHMDMRQEYEGEINSHACISRHIFEGITQKYASVGIRSGTREEYEYVSEKRIKVFSADDVFSMGIEKVIEEIRKDINGPTYLSIDMDALDPAYAPALGTPEPYGISARDVRTVISCLAPDIVGLDVVEIAPAYDSGVTALLGARFVRDFIAASARARS